MFKLMSLFAVLALASAAYVAPFPDVNDLDNTLDNTLDSDLSGAMDTRMVGGDIVSDANAFSFMVGIQPKYTLNGVANTKAPFCSGVLISGSTVTAAGVVTAQNYVLTSAHCAQSGTTYDFYAGQVKVTAVTTPTEADVAATTAIINEEFRQTSMTGDLAVIPTTIVPGANPAITAAKLASINDATKSYLISGVTMAGWGFPNDVYTDHSPSLRSLSSWVVPNWYCAVRHITMPIKRTHVCSAGLPNKGPCTGDSGAPLVAQTTGSTNNGNTATGRVVIGLATQTPRAGCSRGKPGVFTRIGDYLPWIIQETNYDPDA